MTSDNSVVRCHVCGAKMQMSPQTGELVCLLCAYEPVHEVNDSQVEMLEDPYVEVERQLREDRKINQFVYLLKNSVKDIYVTKALVGLNVLVFMVMISYGVSPMGPTTDVVISWGGNYSSASMFGEPWRLFTCMFIHIGVIHLFFNMMVLWSLGDFVEKIFGNVNFLLLYIFSGLIGSLVSNVWNPISVSAGASGAVFGVFGALCGYLVICKKDIPQGVFGQMKKNVFLFLGLNLAFGFSVPNIDMAAHMGGLAGGFVAALFLSHKLAKSVSKLRLKKGLQFTVLGSLLLMGSHHQIKKEFNVSFLAIEEKFNEVDAKFQSLWENIDVITSAKDGSKETMIDYVSNKSLPAWRQIRQEFVESRPFGKSNHLYERLDKCMALKQEKWELIVERYSTGNQQLDSQIMALDIELQSYYQRPEKPETSEE